MRAHPSSPSPTPCVAALALLATAAVAQDGGTLRATPEQIHPRTMVALGFCFGDEDVQTSAGSPSGSSGLRSTDASHLRLRCEHFFESQFGFHVDGFLRVADDIGADLGSPDSRWSGTGVFAAFAGRAIVDDTFRLPVRLGLDLQEAEQDDATLAAGAIERSMAGLRVSVEPELILHQSESLGHISELSAFAEFSYGAGLARIEDDSGHEGTDAFCLTWEIGLRYRFATGIVAGLSYFGQRYHVDTTQADDGTTFFGVDDTFGGVMLTAGVRF